MPTRITSTLGAAATSAVNLGAKGIKAGWNKTSLVGTQKAFRDVKRETNQGRGLMASTIKAGAGYGVYMMAPELVIGYNTAKMAGEGASAAIDFRRRRGHEIAAENRYNTIGRGFSDTEAAQTMRQAATQQIQSNKMNARSALGGEARIFSNKNFNQHTRPYL